MKKAYYYLDDEAIEVSFADDGSYIIGQNDSLDMIDLEIGIPNWKEFDVKWEE